jgi:hypothetical protein
VAGEIDAVRVVNDAIEDGVSVGRIADQLVPLVDRDLAGDDRRSPTVAFFEDFEEVVTGGGIERRKTPIIEDEQLHAAERPQEAGVTAIAARSLSMISTCLHPRLRILSATSYWSRKTRGRQD